MVLGAHACLWQGVQGDGGRDGAWDGLGGAGAGMLAHAPRPCSGVVLWGMVLDGMVRRGWIGRCVVWGLQTRHVLGWTGSGLGMCSRAEDGVLQHADRDWVTGMVLLVHVCWVWNWGLSTPSQSEHGMGMCQHTAGHSAGGRVEVRQCMLATTGETGEKHRLGPVAEAMLSLPRQAGCMAGCGDGVECILEARASRLGWVWRDGCSTVLAGGAVCAPGGCVHVLGCRMDAGRCWCWGACLYCEQWRGQVSTSGSIGSRHHTPAMRRQVEPTRAVQP